MDQTTKHPEEGINGPLFPCLTSQVKEKRRDQRQGIARKIFQPAGATQPSTVWLELEAKTGQGYTESSDQGSLGLVIAILITRRCWGVTATGRVVSKKHMIPSVKSVISLECAKTQPMSGMQHYKKGRRARTCSQPCSGGQSHITIGYTRAA